MSVLNQIFYENKITIKRKRKKRKFYSLFVFSEDKDPCGQNNRTRKLKNDNQLMGYCTKINK
jgi:hypothetical protein